MFELAAFEINQAHRERELAAELRDRRLLKTSQRANGADTRQPASSRVAARTTPSVSTADR